MKLTCVELFVWNVFFFVEDVFFKISLIGILLVEWCFVELTCDIVADNDIGV